MTEDAIKLELELVRGDLNALNEAFIHFVREQGILNRKHESDVEQMAARLLTLLE